LWCCYKKGILLDIEVETKNVCKAKQTKDRNIVHNPDMNAGTSDNRYNNCFNIKCYLWWKKYLGDLAQFYLRKIPLSVLTPGILNYFWQCTVN
jgi:hypothetical protein